MTSGHEIIVKQGYIYYKNSSHGQQAEERDSSIPLVAEQQMKQGLAYACQAYERRKNYTCSKPAYTPYLPADSIPIILH